MLHWKHIAFCWSFLGSLSLVYAWNGTKWALNLPMFSTKNWLCNGRAFRSEKWITNRSEAKLIKISFLLLTSEICNKFYVCGRRRIYRSTRFAPLLFLRHPPPPATNCMLFYSALPCKKWARASGGVKNISSLGGAKQKKSGLTIKIFDPKLDLFRLCPPLSGCISIAPLTQMHVINNNLLYNSVGFSKTGA